MNLTSLIYSWNNLAFLSWIKKKQCKSPIKSSKVVKNIESALHYETDLFMNEGVRGVNLQAPYN